MSSIIAMTSGVTSSAIVATVRARAEARIRARTIVAMTFRLVITMGVSGKFGHGQFRQTHPLRSHVQSPSLTRDVPTILPSADDVGISGGDCRNLILIEEQNEQLSYHSGPCL